MLFQYRDPADEPLGRDGGGEGHVNWGQGLMVAGTNEDWFARRPSFQLRAAEHAV